MHKSVWDATPEELISAGYGSHPRSSIPADWDTRPGPDDAWNRIQKERGLNPKRRARRTYAQLRGERDARFHSYQPEARCDDTSPA